MKCYGKGGICNSTTHLKKNCPYETGKGKGKDTNPPEATLVYVDNYETLFMINANESDDADQDAGVRRDAPPHTGERGSALPEGTGVRRSALPEGIWLQPDVEVRQARDGVSYTHAQFIEHYGDTRGATQR